MTFDDLIRYGAEGEAWNKLALSKDEKLLAVEHRDRLQIYDVQTRRIILDLGQGMLPLWSPGTDKLSFYSVRSGSLQFWIWSPGQTAPRQLSSIPGGIDPDPSTRGMEWITDATRYSWSPTGDSIVFASRVRTSGSSDRGTADIAYLRAGSEPLVVSSSDPPTKALVGIFANANAASGDVYSLVNGRMPGARVSDGHILRSQLHSIRLSDGAVRQITFGTKRAFNPTWSPDGKTIAFSLTAGSDGVPLDAASGEVALLDIASGSTRAISRQPGVYHKAQWSPDGSKLGAFYSREWTERPKIVILNTSGAFVKGPPLDRRLLDWSWSQTSDQILFSYKDGVSHRLGTFSLREQRWHTLTPDQRTPTAVRAWTAASDGTLYIIQSTPRTLTRLVQTKDADRQARILLDLDEPLSRLEMGEAVIFRWRTPMGYTAEGTLLLPPRFRTGRKYPLIVDAYPFAGGTNMGHPMFGNQALASEDYLVFFPSPPAPTGWQNSWKDEALDRVALGSRGWDVAHQHIMSGVDALIETGIVEPEQMCIRGFSNGGGVAANVIARTDRFRCAVIIAPARLDWVRPELLYGQSLDAEAGGELAKDLSDHIKLSAVMRAQCTHTPAMIIAGDEDGDFLLNAIELFNARRRGGSYATLIRYPQQGHILKGSALRDSWMRTISFVKDKIGQVTTEKMTSTAALQAPAKTNSCLETSPGVR